MMMRRALPCFLMLLCMSACWAGFHDADDGYLTAGEYCDVKLEGTDTLIVAGGGGDTMRFYDDTYVEVQYTSTPLSSSSGIYDIVLHDSSELLFLDGIVEEITVRDNTTATLKGGTISAITVYQRPGDSASVEIYCQAGYTMDTDGISGTWADGTSFYIEFLDVGGDFPLTSECVTVIVPEPAMLALLGLGGLLIRRKK